MCADGLSGSLCVSTVDREMLAGGEKSLGNILSQSSAHCAFKLNVLAIFIVRKI